MASKKYETEIQKVYVKAKINSDPMGYSLKDRVLFVKHIPSIDAYDYEAEKGLLETIKDNEGTDDKEFIMCSYTKSIISKIMPESIAGVFSKDDAFGRYLAFAHKDNLLIQTPEYEDMLSITLYGVRKKDLKIPEWEDVFYDSKITYSLLYLLNTLRSKSSLIPVLKYTQYCDEINLDLYKVKDLELGKPTLDELEIGENIHIYYGLERDVVRCFNNGYDKAMLAEYAEVEPLALKTKEELFEEIVFTSNFNTLLYGLEILHAIYSITDSDVKDTLLDLLTKGLNPNAVTKHLFYTNSFGKFELVKDIEDIVYEKDKDRRFDKILKFVTNPEILKECVFDTAVATSLDTPMPTIIFGYLVQFCQEYSLQSIRITNLLVMINYIRNKGYSMDDDTDAVLEDMGLTETMDSLAETMEESTPASPITSKPLEFKTDSLMDLSKKSKGSGASKTGVPGIVGRKEPVLEALDMTSASFSDGGFDYDVKDVIDTSDRYMDKYNAIAESVTLLNKNLIKRIKEIRTYNEGGKNAGKTAGKLDKKNLWKYETTDKIFYDNTYKIKELDAAFGIILDVSGSMHGSGIRNGVITMIILHETLKALGINHSIVTHTEHKGYHTCEIKRYQNFKEQRTYNVRKNYALASITAESGNCDAAALLYMQRALSQVRNKDKICIMFSDGQPTECSDTELKEQVARMERAGIKVIGVGINFESIKHYYPNNANGKNLKEMLDIVSNILQQYILEKKD